VLATVALALALPACVAASGRAFDPLIEEYVARRAARAPGQAAAGEPAPMSEASLLADIAWTRGLAARLVATAGEPSPRADVDRDLLAARIARDLLALEVVQRWARDPAAYRALVELPVRSALTDSSGTPCRRLRRAASHLAAVPEGLRAAQVLLKAPPRALIEAALPGWQTVLHRWQTAVEAPVTDCHDAQQQADLAEADSAAVHALEQFLEGLDALRQAPEAGVALGAEAIGRALACEAESAGVDSLIARALAELERDRPRLERLAARLPGGNVAAALEALRLAGSGAPRITGAVAPLLVFARDHDLLTVTANDAVLPAAPHPDPDTDESIPLERYLEGRARALSASQLAALPDAPADAHGRALYWEQVLVEHGLGAGDPRIELERLARADRALGRLVVALSIHARAMSLRDAERFLFERCFVPPHLAARDVVQIAVDPTSAFGALVRWRLLELRSEVERRQGSAFRLRAFHDLLLRQGAVPAPNARRGVLRDLESAASLGPGASPNSGGAQRRREAKVDCP
jgi:uncharacterized protein DUF885